MLKCLNCNGLNKENARFCRHCGAPIADTNAFSTRLQLGTVLDGRYKIIDYVAKGGMGAIYKAVDLTISGIWAVKEMLDYFDNEKEREYSVNRFATEAQILYELDHESIPKFVDCFISENRYYLIMEFVEGIDLRKQLEDAQDAGKQGLDEWDVTNWAMQVCDVMHYLHTQDPPIIYRDLKPGNIMVTQENKVFLVDFGIARLFDPRTKGTMVGTQGYAPPEQYRGQAEPRSDMYSLAACMHHLLTGKDPRNDVPFTFPLARSIRPQLSQKIEKIMEKALHMDPEKRFTHMMEMREALMAQQFSPTSPVTIVSPIPPAERRPPEASVDEMPLDDLPQDMLGEMDPELIADVRRTEEDMLESDEYASGLLQSISDSSGELPPVESLEEGAEEPEELYLDPDLDMELSRELSQLKELDSYEFDGGYEESKNEESVLDGKTDAFQQLTEQTYKEELPSEEYILTEPTKPVSPVAAPAPEPLKKQKKLQKSAQRNVWYMFRQDHRHSGSSSMGADIEGSVRWSFNTGSAVRSSPVVDKAGNIYFGAKDGYLYALNPDGELIWKYQTNARIVSSPSLDRRGNVFIGSNDCYLHALRADGRLQWKFRTYGRLRSSPCIDEDGTIYIGSYDHYLYSIRKDGRLKWRINLGGYLESTAAIDSEGRIVIASRGASRGNSYIYSLDRNGAVKWYNTIKAPIRSSPCISKEGSIYVGAMDGTLYACNPDGSQKWKFKTGGPILSSPVANGHSFVVVGSNDCNVYCLDNQGNLKWKCPTFSPVTSSPALASGRTIYVGCDDYYLYSIAVNGKVQWKMKAGDRIRSSPSIGGDDVLYVGSDDGCLYAVQ